MSRSRASLREPARVTVTGRSAPARAQRRRALPARSPFGSAGVGGLVGMGSSSRASGGGERTRSALDAPRGPAGAGLTGIRGGAPAARPDSKAGRGGLDSGERTTNLRMEEE